MNIPSDPYLYDLQREPGGLYFYDIEGGPEDWLEAQRGFRRDGEESIHAQRQIKIGWLNQLIAFVGALAEARLVHGNITAENILIARDGTIRIGSKTPLMSKAFFPGKDVDMPAMFLAIYQTITRQDPRADKNSECAYSCDRQRANYLLATQPWEPKVELDADVEMIQAKLKGWLRSSEQVEYRPIGYNTYGGALFVLPQQDSSDFW